MADPRRSFVALDGLRGIAAVLVVIYHLRGGKAIVPGGYLAVDLFFMLSGFVVAHAYEDRLRQGMTVPRFATVRAVRLYPLYIAGCAISVASALAAAAVAQNGGLARDTTGDLPFALLLLPRLSLAPEAWFRLNPPAWSLFAEWTFNLVYAVLLPMLTTRRLVVVATGAFVAIVALCVAWAAPGQGIPDVPLFPILRPVFGLSAGCVVWRLWRADRLPRVRVPVAVPVLMLLAITQLPYGGAFAAGGFPLVLGLAVPFMLLAGLEPVRDARTAAWMHRAGAMSYPLYALHWPLMEAADRVWPHRSPADPVATLALLGGIGLIAWLAMRFYDEPVRRRLTRMSLRAAAAPARMARV